MRLTVRQLYYRLVARQLIENSLNSYKRVVDILARARRRGDVDYESIEDRTREVKVPDHDEEEPARVYFQKFLNYVKELDENYTMPLWWNQPVLPIVFVEKEALASVFEEVTDPYQVDLVVCRGYPSLTLMHELSKRIIEKQGREGVEEVVGIYFGDFDPSGADIERSVGKSLDSDFDTPITIERAAITMEQIRRLNIPHAPAKVTDSRTNGFVAREGVAWQVELDAIEPRALQELIKTNIVQHFDVQIKRDRDEELRTRKVNLKRWVEESVDMDYEAEEDGSDA